jgi:hypothetical protein
MAIVLLQMGINSGSLTTLPNSPTETVEITEQKTTSNKTTYHGGKVVNVIGSTKKEITLTFVEVKDVNYDTFVLFASAVRKWWVRLTGRTGKDIINAFCYVEFSNIKINRVGDDTIAYDFNINIYEI